jgi:hypothetical protein
MRKISFKIYNEEETKDIKFTMKPFLSINKTEYILLDELKSVFPYIEDYIKFQFENEK